MTNKSEIKPSDLGHKSAALLRRITPIIAPLDPIPITPDNQDRTDKINSAADTIYLHACHEAVKNLPPTE